MVMQRDWPDTYASTHMLCVNVYGMLLEQVTVVYSAPPSSFSSECSKEEKVDGSVFRSVRLVQSATLLMNCLCLCVCVCVHDVVCTYMWMQGLCVCFSAILWSLVSTFHSCLNGT